MVLERRAWHVGTQFEYLYPLTMIVSLLHLFIIAFVMSAVCQRWTSLLIGAGFISFRSLFMGTGPSLPPEQHRRYRGLGAGGGQPLHPRSAVRDADVERGSRLRGHQQLH